jgi:hypothetical protein
MAFWIDQRAGAAELARILTDNGKVIIVESIKGQARGRRRARGVKQITELLASVDLHVEDTDVLRRSVLLRPLARAFICSL